MNAKKMHIIRIVLSAILFLAGIITEAYSALASLILFALAFLIVGADVILRAVRNILSLDFFDENFLMCISSIGAFAIQEYPEAVAVMLLYQIGELFQDYAVGKSRASIMSLMDIRPDYANLLTNGELHKVNPADVHIGNIIRVLPGEKIPLDAVIIEGETTIDTSALTGESVPVEAGAQCEVLSGSINLTGMITCEVKKEFSESTASKILDLVETASSKKAKSENFITAFSHWYTPSVVICAVLLAAIPPVFIKGAQFTDWLYRALTFLVISCPCALVISVPLSFFAGLGNASRQGILIKGSNYLEALCKADTMVFDKTGTVTRGVFKVVGIHAEGVSENELLSCAAHAESYSHHPIAASLKSAAQERNLPIDPEAIFSASELSGFGVVATVNGREVTCGNEKMFANMGIRLPETDHAETPIYVALDGAYAGYILIADEIKNEARTAFQRIRAERIKKLVMLTGDKDKIGKKVAEALGFDRAETELLPGDKVAKLEALIEKMPKGKKLAYVGDGMNDAPVLARADIGIAMGSLGSDAAIEAADIVIMTDELTKIPDAIHISRRTRRIVKENIIFALSVKFLVLILGAVGFASMWTAVFADVGVMMLAVLNAMRLLKRT